MRAWILLVVAAASFAGCTHTALERRTINQASTLTDLQYKQVLDNLAMFAANRNALPWHVKLTGGTIQIADSASGGLAADLGEADSRFMPAVGAERGVLNQWDVEPTVDSDELEHLALVYQKAVNPGDPEVWNQIHDAIVDLSVRFSRLPGEETIHRIIWKHQSGRYPLKGEWPPQTETLKDYPAANRVVALIVALKRESAEQDKTKGKYVDNQTAILKNLLIPSEIQSNYETLFETWIASAENPRTPGPANDPAYNPAAATRNFEALDLFGVAGNWDSRSTPEERIGTQRVIDTFSTKHLILSAMHAANPPGYLPNVQVVADTERNPGLIDQAEDKVRKFEDLLTEDEFQVPWLGMGRKKDVPECACYVGHHCICGQECYVWVMPENMKHLREYTLTILTLAPIPAQDQQGGRGGAAFSPSF